MHEHRILYSRRILNGLNILYNPGKKVQIFGLQTDEEILICLYDSFSKLNDRKILLI